MSTERDPNAVIAAWLDEGPTELPDQHRRAIVTAIRTIPQRRQGLGLPWRFPTMNGYTRFALVAAAVAVVALGGIYLFNPGPPGSLGGPGPAPTPTPTPTPTAAPSPTSLPASAGTITLTNDGCTWDQPSTRWNGPAFVRIEVVNQTTTFGNFGLYRLVEGRTWAEAAAWVIADNEAVQTGATHDLPADFVIDEGNADAPANMQNRIDATLFAGTYGVVCSANEPPPGAVFNVYLVGPLEVE
jgi:hypothetical protein